MEQFGFTAINPLLVPRRFFWNSMTSKCSGLISGTTIGTSGVQRCALLLETTGVSVFAYASSIALISSFDISTAENTKSTVDATCSTSFTFITTSFFTASGIGVSIFQRPPTASSYVFPALLGLAARVTTSNHGWFSSREINLCPTIPVAPKIPTLNFCSIGFISLFFCGVHLCVSCHTIPIFSKLQLFFQFSCKYFLFCSMTACIASAPGAPIVLRRSTQFFMLMAS